MVYCLAYQRRRSLNWQRVQNAAARLILGIGKFSHITPALYELHWLPASLRIDYKILLLTLKCIYGLAPTYLSDLISIKSNSLYNLRCTGKLLLTIPRERCLQHWEQHHFQHQLRNSGMAYLWSFAKQHHFTVLNLDLKLIFLRSIFTMYNLILFFYYLIVKRYWSEYVNMRYIN